MRDGHQLRPVHFLKARYSRTTVANAMWVLHMTHPLGSRRERRSRGGSIENMLGGLTSAEIQYLIAYLRSVDRRAAQRWP